MPSRWDWIERATRVRVRIRIVIFLASASTGASFGALMCANTDLSPKEQSFHRNSAEDVRKADEDSENILRIYWK